jgi:hypothetical protein
MKKYCYYLVLILGFGLSGEIGMAQIKKPPMNQLNAAGEKEGYWVTENGRQRIETYYHKGKKSGVFKSLWANKLSCIGVYQDDIECEKWYYFGDYGQLLCMETDFQENTDSIKLDDGKVYTPDSRCYRIQYYDNGHKKREGNVYYFTKGDREIEWIEYGEWKYYNEEGNLIETKQRASFE